MEERTSVKLKSTVETKEFGKVYLPAILNMKKIGFCIVALALLSSCASLLFNTLLSPKVEEIKLVNRSTMDEVVFIPMVHISHKSFYKDVARKVDSLNNLGYSFIYESVSSNLKDSIQKDLVWRKFRKVMGFQPSYVLGNERVDTVNRLIMDKFPYPAEVDLMSQPSYAALNIDTSKSICGDVSLEIIIAAFEQKNGEITLSECDMETGFEGDYNCLKGDKKEFVQNFIMGYRDSILVENFLALRQSQVAIIYGARHFKGFYKRLKDYDSNWKKTK